MKALQKLFENNRCWAAGKVNSDPSFFVELSKQQNPRYMWIGCADSRIPANEILGLQPGEIFVHRNIANLFLHTDFNALSVLQYAVDVLKVEHVIVCGHYGCGGVAAAMESTQFGLVDNWLRNIRDVYDREKEVLQTIEDREKRYRKLIELNILHQTMHVCQTTIVQNAWQRGQKLWVHGWVYDLATGLLQDLNCCLSSLDQVSEAYRTQNLHL